MKKTILLYGFFLAVLTGILNFIEYRFLVRDLSVEFYVGAVAVFFTAFGIWMGLKLTNGKPPETEPILPSAADIDKLLTQHGISKREHEVLTLIAQGYSNQEIAEQLFVSLNTVKTHSSNLFVKLKVKRRTQAVQRAKLLGLLGGKEAPTFG